MSASTGRQYIYLQISIAGFDNVTNTVLNLEKTFQNSVARNSPNMEVSQYSPPLFTLIVYLPSRGT